MFLDREQELGLLADALTQVGVSGGKVILVRGEAGIGKSALIREFLASSAASAEFRIGFCDDLQTPQPYGPLWDIAREAPTLWRALQDRDRHGVLEACFQLLGTSSQPQVVVLEDTQWSDDATLDAIKYVGRRIARTTGLVVLTYRDGEVDHHHPLRRVVSDLAPDTVVRIELGGLSRPAVATIVGPSGLDADRVMDATGGNPFLVTEMTLADTENVPRSVRESVMSRVSKLSAASQQALKTFSVVPRRMQVSEALAITGASLRDLAECEAAGMLLVEADVVAFQHDLIRRGIEAALTISESVAIHRRLLDVIPADADPAWLAYHARGGSDIERLLEVAPQAAESAQAVGSNNEAAAHYRHLAPHLSRVPPERRAEILQEWALVEHYLENVDCIEIVDQAIGLRREIGSDKLLAQSLVLGIELNRLYGRFEAAKVHALEAIEIMDRHPPSAELADALTAHAWLLIHTGEIEAAEIEVDRAIAVAEETDAELGLIGSLSLKGVLLYVRGRAGGLDLLEEMRERARQGGYRYEEVSSLLRMARVALEIRDVARASDFSLQAQSTAARYEFPILETEAGTTHAESLGWSGAWTEAADIATELIGRHTKTDMPIACLLGRLHTRTGRPTASEYLEQAWSLARASNEIDYLLASAAGLAEGMWIYDRPDHALLSQFRDLVERGVRAEYPWPSGQLALWLWKLDAIDETPEALPAPYRDLFAGRVVAAAEFWRSRGIPYEQAISLMSGDVDQRLQALASLESLGASAVAYRVRRDLRADGVST
ncbi:MAG: ATP-binding protein, partial [Acidimicrobiia bacterium]